MNTNKKDLIKIIKSYRDIHTLHKYSNLICDRFGYWNNIQIHKLPIYTNNTLEKESLKRAIELGPKKILWSGGIDSTFIICNYIKSNIDFIVYCDNQSIQDGGMFYEWMLKNNIKIKKFNNIFECWKENDLLHGDIADQLFSPDEKRRTTLSNDINFFKNLEYMYSKDYNKLVEEIIEYGKLLNKPVDTNDHIIRLINWGSMYFFGRDEIHYFIFPKYRIESFFDTPEFNNIAWTQYWDRSIEDDKPEMHRFICETTQDERMMWGVYRSPTNIEPRLKWNKKNFQKWYF